MENQTIIEAQPQAQSNPEVSNNGSQPVESGGLSPVSEEVEFEVEKV